MKKITLEHIRDAVTEFDPTLENSTEVDTYRTAVVLFAALVHGPDTKVLTNFTTFAPEFVETIRRRMIQAELWTEIDVACDHWFSQGNMICPTAIWLDVLVAQGKAVRRWEEEQGEYRYWHADFAYGVPNSKPAVN